MRTVRKQIHVNIVKVSRLNHVQIVTSITTVEALPSLDNLLRHVTGGIPAGPFCHPRGQQATEQPPQANNKPNAIKPDLTPIPNSILSPIAPSYAVRNPVNQLAVARADGSQVLRPVAADEDGRLRAVVEAAVVVSCVPS